MNISSLDNMMKRYLLKRSDPPVKTENCYDADSLALYVAGDMCPSETKIAKEHIGRCDYCAELIEDAVLHSAYGKQIKLESAPKALRNKVKSLHPALKKKENAMKLYLKKNIWLIWAAISFSVSFFTERHFLQFLILTVIFGLKWVFDKETTRTLIMVYNAWKKHDKDSEEKLEEIFKNRL